jgi:hypothetical protein
MRRPPSEADADGEILFGPLADEPDEPDEPDEG